MRNQLKFLNLLIINILLILNTWNAGSQQIYLNEADELVNRLRLNKSINSLEKVTYSDIDGDPFLYKNFSRGKVILNSGEIFQLDLRFDIFSDQVQFKDKSEVFELTNPDKIAALIIDTVKLQFASYRNSPGDESSPEDSWFIVKADGKCKLLIKKNIRLQAAEPPKAYQEARPAKFIPTNDTYYLKLEGQSAIKINNKKDLLNLLAEKKDEIDKFITSSKLGTKSEIDLLKIISFYNKL